MEPFVLPVSLRRFGAASMRAANGDGGGGCSRASAIASFAAPSDPNGPRTSGRPSSSVWVASTTIQVPDWGSMLKRSSRVCQRPPPTRRSGSASDMGEVSPLAPGRTTGLDR